MSVEKKKRGKSRSGRAANGYGAKQYARSRGGNILLFLLLALFGAFMALPLVFAVINAFKPFEEIFVFPPRLYVVNPTWDNFADLFALCSNTWVPFSKYLFNSVFVSVTATVLLVLISSMCAYPLAKNRFRGKDLLFSLIVTSLLFVSQVTFLPQYIIIARLGLIDTYSVMILPTLGGTLGVFLMKQFMEQLPTALLEAARIDGANEFKVFWRIVMPNVKPAWGTLIVFTFVSSWNDYFSPLVYTSKAALKTLPLAVQQISGGAGSVSLTRAGAACAATLIMTAPTVIIYTLMQGKVIKTMEYSGIKE